MVLVAFTGVWVWTHARNSFVFLGVCLCAFPSEPAVLRLGRVPGRMTVGSQGSRHTDPHTSGHLAAQARVPGPPSGCAPDSFGFAWTTGALGFSFLLMLRHSSPVAPPAPQRLAQCW